MWVTFTSNEEYEQVETVYLKYHENEFNVIGDSLKDIKRLLSEGNNNKWLVLSTRGLTKPLRRLALYEYQTQYKRPIGRIYQHLEGTC